MTSDVDQIVAQLPLDQLCAELGESPDALRQAAYVAVRQLLGGTTQADGLVGDGLVQRLAPYLAPIVLGHLDERVGGRLDERVDGQGAGTVGGVLGKVISGALRR